MYRYVIEYTDDKLNEKFNYDTVFTDFKDSAIFLRSASWHLSAKCNDGRMAIKSITLQHKVDGVWVDY